MGQKTNPTALRLEKTNQHYKSCFFTDRFYPEQLHNIYKTNKYITKVFHKIKSIKPLIYIKSSYKVNQVFCVIPKKRFTRFSSYASLNDTRPFKEQNSKKNQHMLQKGCLASKANKDFLYKPAFSLLAQRKAQSFLQVSKQKTSLGSLLSVLFYKNFKKQRDAMGVACFANQVIGQERWLLSDSNSKNSKDKFKAQLVRLPLCKNLKHKHIGRLEEIIDRSAFQNVLAKLFPLAISKKGKQSVTGTYIYDMCTHLKGICSQAKIANTIKEKDSQLTTFPVVLEQAQEALTKGLLSRPRALPIVDNDGDMHHGMIHASLTSQSDVNDDKYIEDILTLAKENQNTVKRTYLYPVKVSFARQSCHLLAQKISNALKNRISFPRIRGQILWEIKKSKYVKGVRVTLSGRVDSKSKKAQRARKRSFQWGQTELHVISSLVQFTSQDLVTRFGKIGIKVWICYGSLTK